MAAVSEKAYAGYSHRNVPDPDLELLGVGPGTPGGEYLRRFWQPVAVTADLQDVPRRIRIMDEDLVLFRDGRGEIGLLNLHCAHRGTSLEFGMVERTGLRCCYHGWLYDVDGHVLETPGEPGESTLKDRVVHGAYPVHEYKGLVFTYMGPPEHQPPFTPPSSVEQPPAGWRVEVGRDGGQMTEANWLQLAENIIDHSHAVFLHSPDPARARVQSTRPSANPEATREDYFDQMVEVYEPVIQRVTKMWRGWLQDWRECPSGALSVRPERYGDHVWIRLCNFIMPNIVEFSPARSDPGGGVGTVEEVAYVPPASTDWWVPVDDTHSMRIGYQYVCEAVAAPPPSDEAPQGGSLGRESFAQHRRDDYQLRQWRPADYDAQQSQRDIAVHALEHLGTTDRGVILTRKRLREGIRALQRGEDPRCYVAAPGEPVPSYCRNVVLRLPPDDIPEEDRALLKRAAQQVVAALLDGRDPIAAVSDLAAARSDP